MIKYIYPATCNRCGMKSGRKDGMTIEGAIPANQKSNYICPDCIADIVEEQIKFWTA